MAVQKRRGITDKAELARTARQFWQLCASLLILAAVLAARFFAPEETRAFLRRHLVGEQNYTELLETLGEGLRAFFAGENAAEAGGAGKTEPAAEEDTSNSGVGGFATPLYDFSEDILLMDERFLISPAVEGEDDTPPVPFGFAVPANVDYTVHELPFLLLSPAEGRISSGFGYRVHPISLQWLFHYGVDIAANTGTRVNAAADGVVASCGVSQTYGKYILLSHDAGYSTFYAHLNKIRVESGQSVKAGEQIGDMGATGQTTGPHLHFELRKDETLLDPSRYVDSLVREL